MKGKEKTGIVIVGHGSKKQSANKALFDAVEFIKGNGFEIVEPAFLQLSRPTLDETARRLVRRGCTTVLVVPFFLFPGNHVVRDIPAKLNAFAKEYKDIDFVCAKSLGRDPRLKRIVLDNIREALSLCRE